MVGTVHTRGEALGRRLMLVGAARGDAALELAALEHDLGGLGGLAVLLEPEGGLVAGVADDADELGLLAARLLGVLVAQLLDVLLHLRDDALELVASLDLHTDQTC